jgi:hypothetical protein
MYGMTDSDWQAMDADDAEFLAAGMYAGTKAAVKAERKASWAAIDWANVETLEADKRCTFENPDYLYIPF